MIPARLRPAVLSLAALACAAVAPAAASAASIDVAVSPDPLVDRAVTFTAATVTDGQDVFAYARIRPLDGNPCAATFNAETGSSLFSRVPGGTAVTRDFDVPGTYVVCAYLAETGSATPVATRTVPVSVRPNRAGIALQVPGTVTQGAAAPVALVGSTEVARSVFARVRPAGAGPCGPTWGTDAGSGSFVFGRGVAGGFAVPAQTARLNDAGPYVVCAWLQESSSSPVADAVASAAFAVVPPRPTLSEIRLGSASFPAVTFGGAVTRSFRGGTSVGVTVDTPSTVRFTVGRAKGGRRVGSRCLAPTRARRGRPSCTRFVRLRGSFSVQVSRSETLRFSGRIGGRQLARGRYRLYAVARNTTGRSEVRRRTFRIVSRR